MAKLTILANRILTNKLLFPIQSVQMPFWASAGLGSWDSLDSYSCHTILIYRITSCDCLPVQQTRKSFFQIQSRKRRTRGAICGASLCHQLPCQPQRDSKKPSRQGCCVTCFCSLAASRLEAPVLHDVDTFACIYEHQGFPTRTR